MRIRLTSVLVDDQAKAERFYTEILGFVVSDGVPCASFAVDDVVAEHARLNRHRGA